MLKNSMSHVWENLKNQIAAKEPAGIRQALLLQRLFAAEFFCFRCLNYNGVHAMASRQ
jgi:hypothetical protein